MNRLSGHSLAAFRARLRAWYARNKRAMPWRGTRDAYRVWVSEIMLQQTRVAAVEPYYRRFMRRFPTLLALARARSEDVLKLWAGLGYYSRARNLHRAAREMVAKHGGKFPREYEAALALPGVGRYTAAAVLSIAYGEPRAVVDGNVARVVARLSATRGDLRAKGRWKKLEERAQELMGESGEWRVVSGEKKRKAKNEKRKTKNGKTENDARSELRAGKRRQAAALQNRRKEFGPSDNAQARVPAPLAGEWNQAMMELGATVCTPRTPRCGECPVARWCKARKMGIAERIPLARMKRATERIEIAAAVMVDARGRTLLEKPELPATNGLSSGMWQFPVLEKNNEEGRKRGSEEGKIKGVKGKWVELRAVKHNVTFREISLRPFLRRVEQLPALKGARIVRLSRMGSMAISNATRKIARVAALALLEKANE